MSDPQHPGPEYSEPVPTVPLQPAQHLVPPQHQNGYTAPAPHYVVVQQPLRAPGNGFAIASMILGIIAPVVGWGPLVGIFLSFVPTVLAIVFGIVGLVRANRVHVGFGPALAGLILGGFVFLLYFTGFGLLW